MSGLNQVAGIILFLAGAAKALQLLAGKTPDYVDPVSGLPFSLLLPAIATTELVSGVAMVILRSSTWASRIALAIGTAFALYRIAFNIEGNSGEQCACLGTLSNSISFLSGYTSHFLSATAFWILLVGGIGAFRTKTKTSFGSI